MGISVGGGVFVGVEVAVGVGVAEGSGEGVEEGRLVAVGARVEGAAVTACASTEVDVAREARGVWLLQAERIRRARTNQESFLDC